MKYLSDGRNTVGYRPVAKRVAPVSRHHLSGVQIGRLACRFDRARAPGPGDAGASRPPPPFGAAKATVIFSRSAGRRRGWGQRYPSKGLQPFNTGKFARAFRHPGGTQEWGFVENYVDEIADVGRYALDLQAVSVWVLKDRKWSDRDSLETVIDCFLESYRITKYERDNLFSMDGFGMADELANEDVSHCGIFDERPPDLRGIAFRYGAPPDNKVDKKRSRLLRLALSDVGPSKRLSMDLGKRLTLIAGDNGLGKSFILDVIWWAITGNWLGRPALPFDVLENGCNKVAATIEFKVAMDEAPSVTAKGYFHRDTHSWNMDSERPRLSSLCIFVRVDGSFAVADEMRARFGNGNRSGIGYFTRAEVWDGKPGEIEGMVRDWIAWQLSPDRETFSKLEKVLACLSPEDLGRIKPGDPARLPGDPRQIPTIVHPYGTVPVVFSSAGVQSILLLTYMMTWVWHEHKIAARQLGEEPFGRMTIILDEVEAHLHPRWAEDCFACVDGNRRSFAERYSGAGRCFYALPYGVGVHGDDVLAWQRCTVSSASKGFGGGIGGNRVSKIR